MAGSVTVTIRGADQLEDLARAVKKYGDKELRKYMLRGLRTATKPMIDDIRQSARDTLPASGGLAERVASSKIAARNKTTGAGAGVRVVATGKAGALGIAGMNAGEVRHPVFGNPWWTAQAVPPGWWEEGAGKSAAKVRAELFEVMDDVAHKITRSV